MPLKVYFDTNIYRDIAEARISQAAEYEKILIRATRQSEIIIVLSVDVVTEIIPLAQIEDYNLQPLMALVNELVDWGFFMRPGLEIATDDIIEFCRRGIVSDPLMGDNVLRAEIKRFLLNMPSCSFDEITHLLSLIGKGKKEFLKTVITLSKDHGLVNFHRGLTFEDFWKKIIDKRSQNCPPKKYLLEIADNLGFKYKCLASGLDSVLAVPTILLAIGYITHSKFDQIVKGKKEKQSVDGDFRHSIHAAAIGTFVTHDTRLRKMINSIPGHNIEVLSLPELCHRLSQQSVGKGEDKGAGYM